jgi:PAS domain S-box-containing protein
MHDISQLLSSLDIVVLSKTGPGEFRPFVTVPHWFSVVFGVSDKFQHLVVDAGLPFLENFVIDADEHWGHADLHVLWSGPWTEEADGDEVVLEAGATTVDGDSVLVVKRLGETSTEMQEILQTAREQSLRFEDLFRTEEEREKYRRHLEKEVQKRTRELEYTVAQLRQAVDELNTAKDETARQREYFKSLFNGTPEAVVLLDQEGLVIDFNPAFFELFGLSIEAARGRHIDDLIVPPRKKEEAKALSETARSKGMATANDTVRLKSDGSLVSVSVIGAPVVLGGTGLGVIASYRDITDQKVAQQRLEDSFIDLVETVARAMESSDPYTAGHQRGVARMAHRVGELLGCDEAWLEGIYVGGLLHDIGKISIPSSILVKPGALRQEEWLVLQSHTVRGYEILTGTSLPWRVDLMARHHHERLDGSGYPDGLKGPEVTLEARVLAVCDVVEAISSHRPYRPARSLSVVETELKSGRGTRYDAGVVDIVLGLMASGEFPLADSRRA